MLEKVVAEEGVGSLSHKVSRNLLITTLELACVVLGSIGNGL